MAGCVCSRVYCFSTIQKGKNMVEMTGKILGIDEKQPVMDIAIALSPESHDS
jgi:hypothetical protein